MLGEKYSYNDTTTKAENTNEFERLPVISANEGL
jgi:hypothetical protein